MRRAALAAAVVAASGAGALAHAAGVHTLTVGVTPGGPGSTSAPQAKKVLVDYRVEGSEGRRPSPVRIVNLTLEGIVVRETGFPRCTFAQADVLELATVLAACGKAQVGSGRIDLVMGLVHDPTDATGCSVDLRVFNLGRRRLALRVDRSAEEDCLMDPQAAVRATLRRTRLAGRPADRLRFEVPDFLRHPLDGLELAIVRVRATLAGPARRARGRRVGFYSAVGCGKRRLAQVTTLDESATATRTRARARC